MLKTLKRAALTTARGLGVFSVTAESRWRRNRLLILCYHGVSIEDEHQWKPSLFVSQDFLRSRLELLRRADSTVLPLHEAISRLQRERLPPRAVTLTFDDGNLDFLERAQPVLQEFAMPATVYLTTYYSLDQRPVFDPLSAYLLWKAGGRTAETADLLPGMPVLRTATVAERKAASRFLYDFVRDRKMDAREKHELARSLAERLDVDFEHILSRRIFQLMSPSDIDRLDRRLVDVQLHTHRHRTPRDRALFAREVEDNRHHIREMLGAGARLEHFCYPSGDYTEEFFEWLRELGVVSATTCEAGLASAASHPMRLPRIIDSANLSEVELHGWISGASAWLPQRRRAAPSVR